MDSFALLFDAGGRVSCLSPKGYAHIALKLITHGAQVNAQSKDGNTALHMAAREGKLEVVELLLWSGANAETANLRGEKPRGSPEITALLTTPFEHPSSSIFLS